MNEANQSPWHAGERAMQARAGVAARMEVLGARIIQRVMPEQHRLFYPLLAFVVLGAVDADGAPWATVLAGEPGFLHAPTPSLLRISARPDTDDPAARAIAPGAAVGLLGVDLSTRRRNRLNGVVAASDASGLGVAVRQAFGNCPQHIRVRARVDREVPRGEAEVLRGLDTGARAAISAADTFFVASYVDADGERSVDVSHRGGAPGFVRVDGDVLTIPDFSGNLQFNTMGNLLVNPRAGLLFVDFATGDLLQLTGDVELVFDGEELAASPEAERLWRLRVTAMVRRPGALGQRWAPA